MLCSVYLVEYTLHLNSMIEIEPELYIDLKVIVHCPMLAFLCKNLDYKPQSINQSINLYKYVRVSESAFLGTTRHVP